MKFYTVLLAAVLLTTTAFAQWEKASDIDAGSVVGMTVYENDLYLYGHPGGQVGHLTSVSSDNALTWADIRGKFPNAQVNDMISFNDGEALYALMSFDGIHVSADNGNTFSLVNTPEPSEGALRQLASDGETLFTISNNSTVYVSTDRAATWNEITVDNNGDPVALLYFAAVGDTYVVIGSQIGAIVSLDAGATWNENNPEGAVSNVIAHQGNLYASGTNGIYVWNGENETWEARSNGLPGNGSFVFPVALSAHEGVLYTVLNSPFYSNETAYASSDMGVSWTELNPEGYAGPDFATTYNIAANDDYVFLYRWNGNDDVAMYRAPVMVTSVEKYDDAIVNSYALEQNYPNPFNPSTTIRFSIPSAQHVSLKIYDGLGRQVAELINENLSPGNYSFDFDAGNLASGIYYYRISAGGFQQTNKMLLLK